MSKATQGLIVLLLGGVLVGITVSGRYTNYVKPGFAPLLVTSGIILLLLGGLTLLSVKSSSTSADQGEHGGVDDIDSHGHSHGQLRAGWLLLAPILVLVLVAPGPIEASAVANNAGSQAIAGLDAAPTATARQEGYAPNDGKRKTTTGADGRRTMDFPPLPAGSNPAITMREFVLRSLYDAKPTVVDHPVTLVGQIVPIGKGYTDGYTVARLTISCCAADANPIRVHFANRPPYPENTWVAVVATVLPGSGNQANDYVPTGVAIAVQQVARPADPYEH